MYGFLYLDVLRVHTIVRRTNICMASFIWMYCVFIHNCKRTNICMASFIWMYCMCIHTECIRQENRTNICMASFIWMYCMFIQL